MRRNIILLTIILLFFSACNNLKYTALPSVVLVKKRMLVNVEENPRFGFAHATGTGFVVHNTKKNTYFVTAQHVCAMGSEIIVNDKKYLVLTGKLNIQYLKTEYSAEIVYEDILNDVCLLKTKKIYGVKNLIISKYYPEIGEKILYIGAPLGLMANGFVMIIDGRYYGKIKANDTSAIKQGYGIAITFGASGGPVLNKNGKIVGMVVGRDAEYSYLAWGVDLESIKRAIVIAKQSK